MILAVVRELLADMEHSAMGVGLAAVLVAAAAEGLGVRE